MELSKRIKLLGKLGEFLSSDDHTIHKMIRQANLENPWFTEKEILFSLEEAVRSMLDENDLFAWLGKYKGIELSGGKSVGLVLAGNIPMVGLHDVLCVFLTGNHAKIKYSEKDKVLIPFLINKLIEFDKETALYFEEVERLSNINAVIATGSDTSGIYFEKYFGKYPNIIRKHRNSVAVLFGDESDDQLIALGEDVFRYFGLGCRNVSKIYAPTGYDWTRLLKVWERFDDRMEHAKYKHNFDFNYALYLMNEKEFLHNSSIILCPDEQLSSRIGTIHTAFYNTVGDLKTELSNLIDRIQCIVSSKVIRGLDCINPGQAQCPMLGDYADNIDTIEFLLNLRYEEI